MRSWADRAMISGLDAALAVVLLTGCVALAMIQCRQPARRRVWGRLGLLASLVVAPLAWVNPLPRLDLRHPTARPGVAKSAGQEAPGAEPVEAGRAARIDPPADPDEPGTGPLLRLVLPGLIVAYGCGLALALGRLALGVVGSRWLVGRSIRASPAAVELLRDLPFGRPPAERPQLLVSDRIRRPVLVGAWRATILIPPDLDRPEAEVALRLGLLHELAHAEIDDHRYAALANLAHALWFFAPQVWWIRSQLRLDAEFLADHRAVEHFGTSQGYAASLIGLAMIDEPLRRPAILDPGPAPRARLVSAGAADPADSRPATRDGVGRGTNRTGGLASALFQRVQMLLRCPFEVEDRAPRPWIGLVALVVVSWLFLASSVSVRPVADEPDRSTPGPRDEPTRRGFDLAELAIAPQLVEDRLFDLRFRLPAQFRLTSEVFATPDELRTLEILGHRLGGPPTANATPAPPGEPAWHRVEIVRTGAGPESVRVDGKAIRPPNGRDPAPTTLTIRPIPHRMTRLRDLHLSW